MDTQNTQDARGLSIIRGGPLSEMPGLGPLTLPGVIQELVARYGDAEALVWHRPDGRVDRWSYRDLLDRAMDVARGLIAAGVTSHSRVGVLMTQRPEWLAAFFGIGLAGCTAVTLSTFSTPTELEFLLQASGVSVVLFERKVVKKDFVEILTELEPQIAQGEPGRLSSLKFPSLRRLVVTDDGGPAGGAIETWTDFIARGRPVSPALVEAVAAAVTRADPGVLFFSSGTTGRSKGILSPHQALAIQFWRWGRFMGLHDNVRTISANGFFWSGNFCQTIAATLSKGGCIVLLPVFDAAEMLRLIPIEKVTYPVAWPHQATQLIDAPTWATTDLSSLRYVDLDSPLARHPTVRTTHRDPNASYGNTETFTISTGYDAETPPELTKGNSGPALEGCTIKVVDVETGEVVPRGERGEIAVKGPTLMIGYIGTPIGETLDDDGFFRCGDGGYIDAGGRLVFEGRINDIMKTGGANVSPLEVNRVLESMPGVKACFTVGVPHETLGEMVVACVEPFEGAELDEEQVRAYVKERLASYKVPRRVLFLAEDELKMTGTAKVKTSDLRALAAKRLAEEETAAGA